MRYVLIFFLLFGLAAGHAQTLAIVHWSAASADVAQTCYALAQPHTHEDFLPSQHCLPIAGMILGQTAVEELIARKLDKHHHRWAKVIRFAGLTDSLYAIGYSKAKGAW